MAKFSTSHKLEYQDLATFRPTRKEIWREFLDLIDLTFGLFLCCVIYFIMMPVSLIFLGNKGTIYLDAVGLGNTLFNVFGIMASNGFVTGADTTMSQSFGTSNKKMVGVYLQKGLIIQIVLFSMVCVAILINAESLLLLTGQERDISRLGGLYTTILAIAAPIYAFWDLTSRYHRTQNVVWTTLASEAVMAGAVISLHYLFISVLDMGVEGSAAAQVLAYLFGALFMMAVIPCQRDVLDRTWAGFSREAWLDWGKFCSLSFLGLLSVGLQWWALEFCTLLSGRLGKVELAAQAIIFQVNYFIYLVPLSIGVSSNILIGQRVGANEPERGKLCMQLAWILTWSFSLLAIILLLSVRHQIPSLFSNDADVIRITSETLPYLALYHVFDSTVGASLGMCRGVARQKTGALVAFIGIYCIGLPFAIYLTFYVQVGLQGLWLGLALGLLFETAAFLILLTHTDWVKECEAAQIRAGLNPNRKEIDTFAGDRTPLLPSERHRGEKKRYQHPTTSSQPDFSAVRRGKALSWTQILFRRGLAAACCAAILAVGLVLYFGRVSNYPLVPLSNSTMYNDTFRML